MAVTKTTRFQVLKRDGHTCQYCGASAPEVKLTVDHVIPEALGGSDKPDNLVAACKDCNAGKGASNPDSELVRKLSAEASMHALDMANKLSSVIQDLFDEREAISRFDKFWSKWTITATGEPVPKPQDYRETIGRWQRQEIPDILIHYAIEAAMGNNTVALGDKFRYMCGVVYRRLESSDFSYKLGEQKTRLYTSSEVQQMEDEAYRSGLDDGTAETLDRIQFADPVARHIDIRLAPERYQMRDIACRKWDPAAADRLEATHG